MLSVIFKLRINYYTNKGQTSSIMNERNIVSLRSVAQQDSIDSVQKMIFFVTSQQLSKIVLCYKTFLYGPTTQQNRVGDSLSYAPKTLAKFF